MHLDHALRREQVAVMHVSQRGERDAGLVRLLGGDDARGDPYWLSTMAGQEDPFERASRRILSALLEARDIELVSDRGLLALARGMAGYLLRIEEHPERGAALAQWLLEREGVADLWAEDAQLDALICAHWDALDAGQIRPLPASRPSPELEALLLEAEDDADPAWLVYSDWLQSQGDPRGELGALQAAARATRGAGRARAFARVSAFLKLHREELLGVAGQYERVVRLDWGVGALRGAKISTPRYGDKQFHGAALLRALLERPAARYLRALWLGPIDQRRRDQFAEMSAVLLERERPALRELAIGVVDVDGSTHGAADNDRAELGDLRALAERLPRLRRLRLEGGFAELGALRCAMLEQLRICVHPGSRANAEALRASAMPRLRSLSLFVHSLGELMGPLPAALRELVDAERLPALERLEIEVSAPVLVLGALSGRRRPPRLRELVLIGCPLGAEELRWLARENQGLRRVELRGCTFEAGAQALAHALCEEVVLTDVRAR